VAVPPDVDLPANLAFGEFVLDRSSRQLFGPDGQVKLGRRATDVLFALVEERGRLVSKESLLATVWKGTFVTEASLTTAVRELRRALSDESRTPRFVESVYGRGYRFVADLALVPALAPPPLAMRPASGDARPGRPSQGVLGLVRTGVAACAVMLGPMAMTGSAQAPARQASASEPSGKAAKPCAHRRGAHAPPGRSGRERCGGHVGPHHAGGHTPDDHR
jgi:DNA-binding winged helix-turn-helix (wHTH) protein